MHVRFFGGRLSWLKDGKSIDIANMAIPHSICSFHLITCTSFMREVTKTGSFVQVVGAVVLRSLAVRRKSLTDCSVVREGLELGKLVMIQLNRLLMKSLFIRVDSCMDSTNGFPLSSAN